MGFINAQIEGSWKISPEAGALMVGPSAGSGSWWSNSEADVTTRSCYFNDEYVFNADGTFTNDLGAETWIESWQGGGSDACGVPVAPHDGLNPATWSYDGSSITLDGTGAYLGLSKVYNGGELESPDNAPVSITYDITFSDNDETMNLSIFVGPAWLSFKLVTSASIPEDPCADISCGPGETCVDGVCVESQDVNVTFNLDMSSVNTSPDGAFLAAAVPPPPPVIDFNVENRPPYGSYPALLAGAGGVGLGGVLPPLPPKPWNPPRRPPPNPRGGLTVRGGFGAAVEVDDEDEDNEEEPPPLNCCTVARRRFKFAPENSSTFALFR